MSHSRRALEQALKMEGLQYNVALETDIMEMAKRYVEIGMGVAVSHDYVIQGEDINRLGIRNLSTVFPPTQVGLITLKGKFLSRSVRNFIDTLVGGLGE